MDSGWETSLSEQCAQLLFNLLVEVKDSNDPRGAESFVNTASRPLGKTAKARFPFFPYMFLD